MAFRILTRISSLPLRNCLRIQHLVENPLYLNRYSTGSDGLQDATADVHPEQPLRYTWSTRGHDGTYVNRDISSELYHGISSSAFPPEVVQKLDTPLKANDIEIKSDGNLLINANKTLIYLYYQLLWSFRIDLFARDQVSAYTQSSIWPRRLGPDALWRSIAHSGNQDNILITTMKYFIC